MFEGHLLIHLCASLTPVCHAVIRGEDIRGFSIITKEVFYYGLQLGHTTVNQTNVVQVLSRNNEVNA